jgi:hypothetical protein
MYFLVKVLVSALLVAGISELGKRYTAAGALLASLPLVSLLGMLWLYADTRSGEQVAKLSAEIFWLVLPSLALFALLPVLLRRGLHFGLALPLAAAVTVLGYFAMLWLLRRWGAPA